MPAPKPKTDKESKAWNGELYAPKIITDSDTNEKIIGIIIQVLKGRGVFGSLKRKTIRANALKK